MKYLTITLTGALILIVIVKYRENREEEGIEVYSRQPYSYSNVPIQQSNEVVDTENRSINLEVSIPCEEEVQRPAHLNKYVTWSCGNGGRLGNQFWPLFSTYSVGLTLDRKLYINCDKATTEMINHIKWIFPKIKGIYEVMKPEKETLVPLAYENGGPGIHAYEDPRIYLNRTEKYLKMDNTYAQNALFVAPYRKQIDRVLEFGGKITDLGEKIVDERKISVDNVLCAHIRQSDFKTRNWHKSYEDCLASVRYVARMQLNRTLIVMGDDKKFMERMVNDMVASGDVAEDSFYSNYTRAEDLYLARRSCRTFVITSEGSTFGFWLAWLAGEQSAIYYLNEDRTGYNIPQFDSQFPLPWTPINVVNGVVA